MAHPEVRMENHKAPPRSFAARLNHAFAMLTKPDGSQYSNEDVSRHLAEQGERISVSYLYQLRSSKKDNPTLQHIEALAKFFGVPPGYFFDDAVTDRVEEQLDRLRAERERLAQIGDKDEVKLMALRAGELAPDRFRLVSELLDVVYRQQQLERGTTTR
jgi:transcriptional regulator with XRE-family HTH domain